MKKILVPFLVGITLGTAGFFIGQTMGFDQGYQDCEFAYQYRSIEEIKQELKIREGENIASYLHGKAGIKKRDEGSLFQIKYVQYFSGTLTNDATVASAKDVKLKVDYFSKTNSKIGSQEITIYEYLLPGKSVDFSEKINVPENVEDFKFSIVEATPQ